MDKETLLAKITELENTISRLREENLSQQSDNIARYRRVIDSTSDGFLELDLDQTIVDFNTAITEILEVPGKKLRGKKIDKIYENHPLFIHYASKEHLNFEINFVAASGEHRPLLFKRSLLRGADGIANGYLVFCTDLTELKTAQEDLQQAENRYRSFYKNAVQGMYQATLDGRFIRVNPALAQIFGFDKPAQLLFKPGGVISLYKDPADRQHFLNLLNKDKSLTNFEVEMRDREGKPVWVLINARLTKDSQGDTIIEGLLIDNTKKRMVEEKLRHSRERFKYLANHDSLTGLYNTRYLYRALDDLIEESKRENKQFSLVFLDMDNFKSVVDTYGHLNGSQALKEVATTLKSVLTEPSFGVAYGGDEFVLVLPDCDKESAQQHINEVRNQMKTTSYLEKNNLKVAMSASFGIASYPTDADDKEGLLALADEAMFRVKTGGKDGVGLSSKN